MSSREYPVMEEGGGRALAKPPHFLAGLAARKWQQRRQPAHRFGREQ